MRANYNARRTSVVFNPRARVLGRLGENGDGPPGGGDVAEGNYGQTAAEAAFDAATEAAASAAIAAAEAEAASAQAAAAAAFAQQTADYEAASLAASNAAAYAQQQADYEAVSLAASNAATFAATQMANEAALVAAAEALAQANAQTVKSAANVRALVGMIPVVGTVVKAIEFVSNLLSDLATAKTQPGYAASQAAATKALAEAQALAAGPGGDTRVLAEVVKVKNSVAKLTDEKNAGSQAAVTKLYQTYAKRNPNSNELIYWSNTFGPSISADEVQQFQQYLYANEPNLRPAAFATQTAAQPTNNLALPIIAAVAGFLIFGA